MSHESNSNDASDNEEIVEVFDHQVDNPLSGRSLESPKGSANSADSTSRDTLPLIPEILVDGEPVRPGSTEREAFEMQEMREMQDLPSSLQGSRQALNEDEFEAYFETFHSLPI